MSSSGSGFAAAACASAMSSRSTRAASCTASQPSASSCSPVGTAACCAATTWSGTRVSGDRLVCRARHVVNSLEVAEPEADSRRSPHSSVAMAGTVGFATGVAQALPLAFTRTSVCADLTSA